VFRPAANDGSHPPPATYDLPPAISFPPCQPRPLSFRGVSSLISAPIRRGLRGNQAGVGERRGISAPERRKPRLPPQLRPNAPTPVARSSECHCRGGKNRTNSRRIRRVSLERRLALTQEGRRDCTQPGTKPACRQGRHSEVPGLPEKTASPVGAIERRKESVGAGFKPAPFFSPPPCYSVLSLFRPAANDGPPATCDPPLAACHPPQAPKPLAISFPPRQPRPLSFRGVSSLISAPIRRSPRGNQAGVGERRGISAPERRKSRLPPQLRPNAPTPVAGSSERHCRGGFQTRPLHESSAKRFRLRRFTRSM
jgi:hypothetical protein